MIAGSALAGESCGRDARGPSRDNRQPATGIELRILPDPNDLRRPLREQRLAAGAAEAADEDLLGERRCSSVRRPPSRIGYDDKRRDALVNEKQTLLADVKYRGRTMRTPIWVVPGHADGTITMFLGYGRDARRPHRIAGCRYERMSAPTSSIPHVG